MTPATKATRESLCIRPEAGEDVGEPWQDQTSPMGEMLTQSGRRMSP